MKIAELANRKDPDGAVHNHLCCLASSITILNIAWAKQFCEIWQQ